MSEVVYDAAVLIAADRSERRAWADHKARLELGIVPRVPSPVVAQVSRGPTQSQLRRFLRGCEVVPLDERSAHAVGRLLGLSRTQDVVDGAVAVVAAATGAGVVTGDVEDIERLARAAGARLAIVAV